MLFGFISLLTIKCTISPEISSSKDVNQMTDQEVIEYLSSYMTSDFEFSDFNIDDMPTESFSTINEADSTSPPITSETALVEEANVMGNNPLIKKLCDWIKNLRDDRHQWDLIDQQRRCFDTLWTTTPCINDQKYDEYLKLKRKFYYFTKDIEKCYSLFNSGNFVTYNEENRKLLDLFFVFVDEYIKTAVSIKSLPLPIKYYTIGHFQHNQKLCHRLKFFIYDVPYPEITSEVCANVYDKSRYLNMFCRLGDIYIRILHRATSMLEILQDINNLISS